MWSFLLNLALLSAVSINKIPSVQSSEDSPCVSFKKKTQTTPQLKKTFPHVVVLSCVLMSYSFLLSLMRLYTGLSKNICTLEHEGSCLVKLNNSG